MKAKYLILASSLLLAACSSDEIANLDPLASRKAIVVDTYLPGATRAVATDADLKNGFLLMAQTDTETIFNQRWAFDGQKYAPADKETYYWPENPTAKVTFTGLYNPAEDEEALATALGATATLNLRASDADGVQACNDFLVVKKEQSLATSADVSLSFEHLLAQVQMKAAGVNPNYEYAIFDLILSTPTSATLTLSDLSTTYSEIDEVPFFSVSVSSGARQGDGRIVSGNTLTTILRGEQGYNLNQTYNSPMLIAPAKDTQLTVTYAYRMKDVEGAEWSDEITKTGIFTPVKGALNMLSLQLTIDRTPISIIPTVAGWQTNDVEPDLE